MENKTENEILLLLGRIDGKTTAMAEHMETQNGSIEKLWVKVEKFEKHISWQKGAAKVVGIITLALMGLSTLLFQYFK